MRVSKPTHFAQGYTTQPHAAIFFSLFSSNSPPVSSLTNSIPHAQEAIERLLHLDEPAPVVKSLLEYFYTGDYSLPHALQQPMAHHASLIIAARKFDVGGLDALALRRFLDEGEAFSSNADSASDSGDPAATDFFTAAKIIYYSAGDGAGGEDNDVLTAQVLAIASRKMQSLSAESQTRWVAHLIEVPPLAVAFTMKQHSLLQAYEGKPIVAAVAAGKASPQKGGKASTKAVKAAEREREEEVVVVAAPAPVAVPASPRKRKGAKLQQQDVMMMEEFGMPMPELEPALVGERERELEELFEG